MAATQGKNLGVTSGWNDGDNQWGNPMNNNLMLLDTLIHCDVKSTAYSAPEDVPSGDLVVGNRFLVKSDSTTAWDGSSQPSANCIVMFLGGTTPATRWAVFRPKTGWSVTCMALADGQDKTLYFSGTEWVGGSAMVPSSGLDPTWKTQVDSRLEELETDMDSVSQAVTGAVDNANTALNTATALARPASVAVAASTTLTPAQHTLKYLVANGADDIEITVPAHAEGSFQVGDSLTIRHNSDNRVSLVAASGVNIRVPFMGSLELAGKGATVSLYKRDNNTWDLVGQTEMVLPESTRQIVDITPGTPVGVTGGVQRLMLISEDNTTATPAAAIVLPTDPVDGQQLRIGFSCPVTAVTIDAGTKVTTFPPGSPVAAGSNVVLEFVELFSAWLVSA